MPLIPACERILEAYRAELAEEISCDLCHKFLAFGAGDLNVTAFMCKACSRKEKTNNA